LLEALTVQGDLTRTRDGRYVATPRLLMRRRQVDRDHNRGAA
jgi:hypothetical protein